MFFVLLRAWDKEKFCDPMRNRTWNPRIPRSDALLLSHKDSTVSEVYYGVHVIRVLHTVRVSNVDGVMFVDGTRETVSFELGKEIEKDVFSSCHERGTMKKFWGPMRNRTSDLRIPRSEHLHKNLTTKQQHNLCFWSKNKFLTAKAKTSTFVWVQGRGQQTN